MNTEAAWLGRHCALVRAAGLAAALACSAASSAQPLQISKLNASDGAPGDQFGRAAAIDGGVAAVASPGDAPGGSVHVFIRQSNCSWAQEAKLLASDRMMGDRFGSSVGVSGDRVVVGAPFDDHTGGTEAGSAYVYRRTLNGVWMQEIKVRAGDPESGDQFGASVSMDGDWFVVGAPHDDDAGSLSGSAYVFRREMDGVWTQEAKLTASDAAGGRFFGHSVAIHGEFMAVGAIGDDAGGGLSGAAYVFRRQPGGAWAQEAKLTASDAAAQDYFGLSVAIDDGCVVIGCVGDDEAASAAGAVYVYRRQQDGTWPEEAKLVAPDGGAGDELGDSVSIHGSIVVAGAPFDDGAAGANAGSVSVFRRKQDGSWAHEARLFAADGAPNDQLGWSAAISGDMVVAGAYLDADFGASSGSAYVFDVDRTPECVGDLDGEGCVTSVDLAILLGSWANVGGVADLDGDGVVGSGDLAVLLGSWGGCW